MPDSVQDVLAVWQYSTVLFSKVNIG